MDSSRFDHITRLFAVRSRRQIVGLLGGVLALQAAIRLDDVIAKNKKKKCKHGKKKCGRKCAPKGLCCGKRVCEAGEVCVDGLCVAGPADCPASADSCSASDTVACGGNPDCNCYQRLQGGVRCAQFKFPGSVCDQCDTDADCIALGFAPGSSCVKDDGPTCVCAADEKGLCVDPCDIVKA
jgi:hypothetical protein